MKKYKIVLHYEETIKAKDEQEAEEKFYNDTVYDSQSDAESFLMDNLTVKEEK